MEEDRSPIPPDDHPRLKMLGAWILILILLAATAISIVAAIDAAIVNALWMLPLLIFVVVIMFPVGSLILHDYLTAQKETEILRRGKRRYMRLQNEPVRPPSPFRTRLATFLQVPEENVLAPRSRPVSSMPFWSSVSLSPRPIVMKSVEFIRAVLERIHAAVRG